MKDIFEMIWKKPIRTAFILACVGGTVSKIIKSFNEK